MLTPTDVVVLELKTGAAAFLSEDRRQAVEYALDLRDFHAASHGARITPVLWALQAGDVLQENTPSWGSAGVQPLVLVGRNGLGVFLQRMGGPENFANAAEAKAFGESWDKASYQPVPTVIDAAVTLFSGHGVREIAQANAVNLSETAHEVYSVIRASQRDRCHAVVFLTGVPGAGKTLAGLNVVHGAVEAGLSPEGDIVYLSGNTPLVVVLREALSLDQYARDKRRNARARLEDARRTTRATIQHINDFLKEYVNRDAVVPSGHVIVFDEAQRAWNEKQGKEKFGREASEPYLVLEAMARHADWSVTVCLVGLGQEINDGEDGLQGWVRAVAALNMSSSARWHVYAPSAICQAVAGPRSLGEPIPGVANHRIERLHLDVPMRAFRSPLLGEWIEAALDGRPEQGHALASQMNYPLVLTRDLPEAKKWLDHHTQGERRKGLLASSGARRLRADGLGQVLNATDGQTIAHWYLQPAGDIRSSHALEVPANEYTSQGLELDFACLCWGGDLIRRGGTFVVRRLGGNRWNEVRDPTGCEFVKNSYRVLLSRAREGLVVWVPRGDDGDHTRNRADLDAIADYLVSCGLRPIESISSSNAAIPH